MLGQLTREGFHVMFKFSTTPVIQYGKQQHVDFLVSPVQQNNLSLREVPYLCRLIQITQRPRELIRESTVFVCEHTQIHTRTQTHIGAGAHSQISKRSSRHSCSLNILVLNSENDPFDVRSGFSPFANVTILCPTYLAT